MKEKAKKIDLKKIKSEINDYRKTLLNLRFQKSTGQLEKTSEIKKIRKKIASLKTDISISNGELNAK
tara:strand:- start:570 stop:770 length:201 start_codon:yes stop_codon:yes gene_type:complete